MPGKNKALGIYAAHRGELVNYANRILDDHARAEDVVQDAWERIAAIERKGALAEPRRYLFRIVRNLAIDISRVRKREARRDGGDIADIAELIPDETPSAETEMIARDELRCVLTGLEELPERTRLALTLHAVEGLKLREIAERLGISIGLAHALVVEGKTHCAKRVPRRP
ncbi:RNA polymerase sigma factor [Sphingobium cloacae]|uniref:RNA polymerase subunit sigma-24 n=1 Tax=Sphingobium cloacae TaxID=120107 RepID=A0A1E1EYP2_9SPHN|nr:sigma-70 family RNA polymerase sigma factor [Sphingobium cloacae]BAV63379.1 hypothetical protein SCLO_1003390 [Sphingobium cloacae]